MGVCVFVALECVYRRILRGETLHACVCVCVFTTLVTVAECGGVCVCVQHRREDDLSARVSSGCLKT